MKEFRIKIGKENWKKFNYSTGLAEFQTTLENLDRVLLDVKFLASNEDAGEDIEEEYFAPVPDEVEGELEVDESVE